MAPDLPVVTHLPRHRVAHADRLAAGAPWSHGAAWRARMRRWVSRSAAVGVASSDASAASAATHLGLDQDDVRVIPNGIDPVAFDGHRAARAERGACGGACWWRPARLDARRPAARQHLVLPADLAPILHPRAVVVMFVGRFTAVKRAPLLVRAQRRGAGGGSAGPLRWCCGAGSPGEWEGEHPGRRRPQLAVGPRGVPGRLAPGRETPCPTRSPRPT